MKALIFWGYARGGRLTSHDETSWRFKLGNCLNHLVWWDFAWKIEPLQKIWKKYRICEDKPLW